MDLHRAEIKKSLDEWLDRYACPAHLRDKPQAAQAEAEALARVLVKFAPRTELRPFLNQVFGQLDYQMKTRAWPTVSEMAAVCSQCRKETARETPQPESDLDMRPEAITARAMLAGRPVSEGWLYGRQAVLMIAERLIDERTMTAYRSGAFFARKKVYGEASALAWEAEAKERHEAAKVIHRQEPVTGRSVRIPDNRVLDGFAA